MDRSLKVHATSGHNYKPVPTIQIKGSYLNDYGFQIGIQVNVLIKEKQILITPKDEEITEK